MSNQSSELLNQAINLASESIDSGGGPFGALVVRNGKVIATGSNMVTSSNDPTAHAEVMAIRKASAILGTFDLSGCEIYSSCEPCPMCLGAIYWAHIDKVFYAASKDDAREAGFDDRFIYDELELELADRKVPFVQNKQESAIKVFEKWKNKTDKTSY